MIASNCAAVGLTPTKPARCNAVTCAAVRVEVAGRPEIVALAPAGSAKVMPAAAKASACASGSATDPPAAIRVTPSVAKAEICALVKASIAAAL